MAHTCSTLLIRCIDFRLEAEMERHINAGHLLGDCDLVSVAGAAKDLVLPEEPTLEEEMRQRYLLRQIGLSQQLHQIKRVVLMNHTDCGAYGGRPGDKLHAGQLQSAAKLIGERFDNLKVETLLANVKEDGSVSIEQIGQPAHA